MSAFAGKVVIVTGASRGIGMALARRFAQGGARLAIAGRSMDALQRLAGELVQAGGEVMAIAANVGVHEDCGRLVDAVIARWGTVDILINNAGMSGVQKPIHELSYEEFDEVVRANQYSAFSCIHFAARHMVRQRSGAIVNISSVATSRPQPARTSYLSSKRGMTGVTAAAAVDLGPYGVRCNTVSPGGVEGTRLEEVIERSAGSRGVSKQQVRSELVAGAALRRTVSETDVCEMVLFLCSDAAQSVTGQDIGVNAGVRVM